MKLEADQWKLDVVDVDSTEESLFWPTNPTRLYPIVRDDDAEEQISNAVARRPSSILSLQQTSSRPPSGLPPLSDGGSGTSNYQTNGSNPASLCRLALEAFLAQLKNLCQDRNYGETKRGLKHYLKFCLPTPLRQMLLELCLKDGRIYTLVDLNIFELLLSPTVTTVQVVSIRPFFRPSFSAMLRQLGTGIERLVLEDSTWIQGRDFLPAALTKMSSLRQISIRYLANDQMIAALAKHCHSIEEMDVSHSMDVTDAGMKVLSNPATSLLEEERNNNCVNNGSKSFTTKRSRKISAPASCIPSWLPRMIVRGIRRHSVIQQQQSSNRTGAEQFCIDEEDGSNIPWPEEESPASRSGLAFTDPPVSCIRSLRRLDVHDTKVTSEGLRSILNAASQDIILLS